MRVFHSGGPGDRQSGRCLPAFGRMMNEANIRSHSPGDPWEECRFGVAANDYLMSGPLTARDVSGP